MHTDLAFSQASRIISFVNDIFISIMCFRLNHQLLGLNRYIFMNTNFPAFVLIPKETVCQSILSPLPIQVKMNAPLLSQFTSSCADIQITVHLLGSAQQGLVGPSGPERVQW